MEMQHHEGITEERVEKLERKERRKHQAVSRGDTKKQRKGNNSAEETKKIAGMETDNEQKWERKRS